VGNLTAGTKTPSEQRNFPERNCCACGKANAAKLGLSAEIASTPSYMLLSKPGNDALVTSGSFQPLIHVSIPSIELGSFVKLGVELQIAIGEAEDIDSTSQALMYLKASKAAIGDIGEADIEVRFGWRYNATKIAPLLYSPLNASRMLFAYGGSVLGDGMELNASLDLEPLRGLIAKSLENMISEDDQTSARVLRRAEQTLSRRLKEDLEAITLLIAKITELFENFLGKGWVKVAFPILNSMTVSGIIGPKSLDGSKLDLNVQGIVCKQRFKSSLNALYLCPGTGDCQLTSLSVSRVFDEMQRITMDCLDEVVFNLANYLFGPNLIIYALKLSKGLLSDSVTLAAGDVTLAKLVDIKDPNMGPDWNVVLDMRDKPIFLFEAAVTLPFLPTNSVPYTTLAGTFNFRLRMDTWEATTKLKLFEFEGQEFWFDVTLGGKNFSLPSYPSFDITMSHKMDRSHPLFTRWIEPYYSLFVESFEQAANIVAEQEGPEGWGQEVKAYVSESKIANIPWQRLLPEVSLVFESVLDKDTNANTGLNLYLDAWMCNGQVLDEVEIVTVSKYDTEIVPIMNRLMDFLLTKFKTNMAKMGSAAVFSDLVQAFFGDGPIDIGDGAAAITDLVTGEGKPTMDLLVSDTCQLSFYFEGRLVVAGFLTAVLVFEANSQLIVGNATNVSLGGELMFDLHAKVATTSTIPGPIGPYVSDLNVKLVVRVDDLARLKAKLHEAITKLGIIDPFEPLLTPLFGEREVWMDKILPIPVSVELHGLVQFTKREFTLHTVIRLGDEEIPISVPFELPENLNFDNPLSNFNALVTPLIDSVKEFLLNKGIPWALGKSAAYLEKYLEENHPTIDMGPMVMGDIGFNAEASRRMMQLAMDDNATSQRQLQDGVDVDIEVATSKFAAELTCELRFEPFEPVRLSAVVNNFGIFLTGRHVPIISEYILADVDVTAPLSVFDRSIGTERIIDVAIQVDTEVMNSMLQRIIKKLGLDDILNILDPVLGKDWENKLMPKLMQLDLKASINLAKPRQTSMIGHFKADIFGESIDETLHVNTAAESLATRRLRRRLQEEGNDNLLEGGGNRTGSLHSLFPETLGLQSPRRLGTPALFSESLLGQLKEKLITPIKDKMNPTTVICAAGKLIEGRSVDLKLGPVDFRLEGVTPPASSSGICWAIRGTAKLFDFVSLPVTVMMTGGEPSLIINGALTFGIFEFELGTRIPLACLDTKAATQAYTIPITMRIPPRSLNKMTDQVIDALNKLGLFVLADLFKGILPSNWMDEVLPRIKEFSISGSVVTTRPNDVKFQLDMSIDIFGKVIPVNMRVSKVLQNAADFGRFFRMDFVKPVIDKVKDQVWERRYDILCHLGKWLSRQSWLQSRSLDLFFIQIVDIGLVPVPEDTCIKITGKLVIPVLPFEIRTSFAVTKTSMQVVGEFGINIFGGYFGIIVEIGAPLTILDPSHTDLMKRVVNVQAYFTQSVLDMFTAGLSVFPGLLLPSYKKPKVLYIGFGILFAPKNTQDMIMTFVFELQTCGPGTETEIVTSGKLGVQTVISIASTVFPAILNCMLESAPSPGRRRLTEEEAWHVANATAVGLLEPIKDMKFRREDGSEVQADWYDEGGIAEIEDAVERLKERSTSIGSRQLLRKMVPPSDGNEKFARDLIRMWDQSETHQGIQDEELGARLLSTIADIGEGAPDKCSASVNDSGIPHCGNDTAGRQLSLGYQNLSNVTFESIAMSFAYRSQRLLDELDMDQVPAPLVRTLTDLKGRRLSVWKTAIDIVKSLASAVGEVFAFLCRLLGIAEPDWGVSITEVRKKTAFLGYSQVYYIKMHQTAYNLCKATGLGGICSTIKDMIQKTIPEFNIRLLARFSPLTPGPLMLAIGLTVEIFTLCLDPIVVPFMKQPICPFLSLAGEGLMSMGGVDLTIHLIYPNVMPLITPRIALVGNKDFRTTLRLSLSFAPSAIGFRGMILLTNWGMRWGGESEWDRVNVNCQMEREIERFKKATAGFGRRLNTDTHASRFLGMDEPEKKWLTNKTHTVENQFPGMEEVAYPGYEEYELVPSWTLTYEAHQAIYEEQRRAWGRHYTDDFFQENHYDDMSVSAEHQENHEARKYVEGESHIRMYVEVETDGDDAPLPERSIASGDHRRRISDMDDEVETFKSWTDWTELVPVEEKYWDYEVDNTLDEHQEMILGAESNRRFLRAEMVDADPQVAAKWGLQPFDKWTKLRCAWRKRCVFKVTNGSTEFILKRIDIADPRDHETFLNETSTMVKLQGAHNTLRIERFDWIDKWGYILMPFVPYPVLLDYVTAALYLGWSEDYIWTLFGATAATEVSQGIQHLHRMGLGHGDLKLDNILVTDLTESRAEFSRLPRAPLHVLPSWLGDQVNRDSGLQAAIEDLQNGLVPSHFSLFDFGKASKLEAQQEVQNRLTRKNVDAYMWTMTILQLRHATDALHEQMLALNGRRFARQMDEDKFNNLVETLALGMWEDVDDLLSSAGIQTSSDQSVHTERPRRIRMKSSGDRHHVVTDVEELPSNWWYDDEHPVIRSPINPDGTPDGRRLDRRLKTLWCKKIMTDFYINARDPMASYLFYRQPDVISFMDLFEAVVGIDTPMAVRNFIDYIFPKLGPILILMGFENNFPKIKLQAVIQWGSLAAMGDFYFSIGALRLEMEFVIKAGCLGIELCGCTGVNVLMSSFPRAREIAYRTYDSVVAKIQKEFPEWTPPFRRDQMGPSISLTAGLGVTNQISGQAQGYISIMNVQIFFLPRIDAAFELSTRRMYLQCRMTYNAFGAICGVEFLFDLQWSPFSLYFENRIFWDFGRMLMNLLPGFLRKVLDWAGISLSIAGGVLIGGGTTGFKFGFSIFGWSFELSISFGRIRRKLQERNQTLLAKLDSFDSSMTPDSLLVKLDELNSSTSNNPEVVQPHDDWDFLETFEDLMAQNPCYIGLLITKVPRFKRLQEDPAAEANFDRLLIERMHDKIESDPTYKEQYESCLGEKKMPEVFRANMEEERAEDVLLLLLQEGVDPLRIEEKYDFEIDILPDLYEIAFGHKWTPGRRLGSCFLGDMINAIGEFISDPLKALGKMLVKLKDAICSFLSVICRIIYCLCPCNFCDCFWCPSFSGFR
jgi:serine/threonine protein kinase